VDERKEFILEWRKGEESVSDLCRCFGISRETAYKWIKRYQLEGEAGLIELSRAPLHSPQQMSEGIQETILDLRQEHVRWGPRKLRAYLQRHQPEQNWPATSSIGDLLRREGLAHPRRKRRRTPPYTQPLAHAVAPNQLWCVDYKGWFRCGDGSRCDPLTISDACSRYLLRSRAVDKTDEVRARGVFEAVFHEYGLPEAIRSDNGPPFASPAPGGLSRLSIWWIRLGIRHERIEPGHPEQNGQHERMHQTLREETADPPEADLRKQQEAFRRFEHEFNHVRPHEALAYRTPADVYVPSARPYPVKLPEIEYPDGMLQRRVSSAGELTWKNQDTYLSRVLAGQNVGLLEVDEHLFEVYFGPQMLGWFDNAELCFVADRAPRWHGKRPAQRKPKSEDTTTVVSPLDRGER
jgi:transposase InsO family protein